jgi:mannitol/fructose-specific phosphotransferase system IIA component (Ntr-type)
MKLVDFLSEDTINLNLRGETKEEILVELVEILRLGERSHQILIDLLNKREKLGSTGIGKGVAIPHCRSLVINRLVMAFGKKENGVNFDSIDGKPAHYFFLIIAPPLEISNLYLPVLGKVAQYCKDDRNIKKLARVQNPKDFMQLLEELEVK